MEKEIKAAVITGVCGILAAIITYNVGARTENGTVSADLQELQAKINELEEENELLTEQVQKTTTTEGAGQEEDTFSDTEQTEEQQVGKTNILALPPFKEGRNEFLYTSGDRVDNVGNTYPDGYLIMYNSLDNSFQEKCYLLDKKYSNLSGEIALSYNDKDVEGEVWIEFYNGDNLIKKTKSLYSGVKPVDFSVDVSQVSELTIRVNGGNQSSSMLTQGFYLE